MPRYEGRAVNPGFCPECLRPLPYCECVRPLTVVEAFGALSRAVVNAHDYIASPAMIPLAQAAVVRAVLNEHAAPAPGESTTKEGE